MSHIWEELIEPIYRAEAEKRHGARTDIRPVTGVEFGEAVEFMAKDAPAKDEQL